MLVEREVDAKLLLEGGLVKVPPGAKIPADGIVRFGTSEVDESALTGESVPVPKKQGYKVVGDQLNHAGSTRVRLSGVGEKSAVAQIAQLVEEAQSLKAPVQDLADRIASRFCACCGQRGCRYFCSLTWRRVQRFGADPVAP